MSLLAQRYAKAIFEVAEKHAATDAVSADLARLAQALGDPGARLVVLSPETSRPMRSEVLAKLLGAAHELTTNLIGVVLRRRRQAVLPDLSGAFEALLRSSRGEVQGVVETARPVDAEGLAKLQEHATRLVGKKVTLDVEVDADLIGGVRLRVGNTLYDGSVATVLEDLERSLMEAPL